jgi:hypothetical protein
MADPIFNHAAELDSPVWEARAITPNDGANLPVFPTRGLYVGEGGNISVIMAGGTTLTFAGVGSGAILPIRVDRVRATGTTAGSIVALY